MKIRPVWKTVIGLSVFMPIPLAAYFGISKHFGIFDLATFVEGVWLVGAISVFFIVLTLLLERKGWVGSNRLK